MATTVNATLKHKRGTEASIPTLKEGQLYLCSDNHRVYKGTSTGTNVLVSDINLLNTTKTALDNVRNTGIKYITRDVTITGTQEVNFDYLPNKFIIIATLNDKVCIGLYDSATSLSIVDLSTTFSFDTNHPIIFYTSGIENGVQASITRNTTKLIITWSTFGSNVSGTAQIGILGI